MTSITSGEPIITRLAAGEREPLLVVDFDGFTDAPNLSVLLAEQASDRPVYQVDPIGFLSGRRPYLPLPDLAAAAAGAFASCGEASERTFVVGYCSSAALALRIAGLTATASTGTVLLVRPTWPDEQMVTDTFDQICEGIGGSARQCPGLDGDPAEVLAAMTGILAEELAALAERMGLGQSAEPFSELLDRYHAWLGFLLASRADIERDAAAGVAVPVIEDEGSDPAELASLVLAHIHT